MHPLYLLFRTTIVLTLSSRMMLALACPWRYPDRRILRLRCFTFHGGSSTGTRNSTVASGDSTLRCRGGCVCGVRNGRLCSVLRIQSSQTAWFAWLMAFFHNPWMCNKILYTSQVKTTPMAMTRFDVPWRQVSYSKRQHLRKSVMEFWVEFF